MINGNHDKMRTIWLGRIFKLYGYSLVMIRGWSLLVTLTLARRVYSGLAENVGETRYSQVLKILNLPES